MAGTTPIVRRSLVALVALLALAGCSTSGSGSDAAPTSEAPAASTTDATDAPATTEAPDDTEPPETTEVPDDTDPTEGDDDICSPLQVLSDYDQESAAIIAAGDWTATQAFFVEGTDAVLAAYDDAIAVDSEVTDQLQILRDFTDGTSELAASSTDLSDFSSKLTALPNLQEAGVAGEELNTFAESTCGFSTGGAGN